MIVDDSTRDAIGRLFPLLPWALGQMQLHIDPKISLDLEPGTKAAIAHDIIMREGERRFTDPEDIVVADAKGLLHFVLPNALLRVKRGDSRYLTIATNRTRQTLVWTYQMSLDGMANPLDFLHMVYVPDQFWTVISRCVVGVYHGRTPRTWYEVDVDDWYESGGAEVYPFAPEPQMPPLKLKPGVTPLPLEEIDGTS